MEARVFHAWKSRGHKIWLKIWVSASRWLMFAGSKAASLDRLFQLQVWIRKAERGQLNSVGTVSAVTIGQLSTPTQQHAESYGLQTSLQTSLHFVIGCMSSTSPQSLMASGLCPSIPGIMRPGMPSQTSQTLQTSPR